MLEETDGLAKDAGIDLVPQIGDGSEAGILNLRGTDVFREGFCKKEYDEGDGEDGPDVVDSRGEIIVEINDFAAPGNCAERQPRTSGAKVEDEVHGQPDHERHATFGQRHER